jgi:hypothetical protein
MRLFNTDASSFNVSMRLSFKVFGTIVSGVLMDGQCYLVSYDLTQPVWGWSELSDAVAECFDVSW